MRFVFLRHPEFLLSVSPLLDGYLTVATGFLIAHVFSFRLVISHVRFCGLFYGGNFLGIAPHWSLCRPIRQSVFCRTLLVVPAPAAGAAFSTDNRVAVTIIQCLIGLFIGTNQLVSQAIVTELSAPEKRSKRLLFLMLAWYVGALTAVAAEFLLLSATTIEGSSWHAFYALSACLCLLSLPLRHRLMQEFHPSKQPQPSKQFPR